MAVDVAKFRTNHVILCDWGWMLRWLNSWIINPSSHEMVDIVGVATQDWKPNGSGMITFLLFLLVL